MYADFQSRTRRRAVAQIEQDLQPGPKSKKQRRVEVSNAVQDEEREDEIDLARRVVEASLAEVTEHNASGDDDRDEDEGAIPESCSRGGTCGRGGSLGSDNKSGDCKAVDDEEVDFYTTRQPEPLPFVSLTRKTAPATRLKAENGTHTTWFTQDLFWGLAEEDGEEQVPTTEQARAIRNKGDVDVLLEENLGNAANATHVGASDDAREFADNNDRQHFVSAAAFCGARSGYVFKMGSSGMGYYWDATPNACLQVPAAAHDPVNATGRARAGSSAVSRAALREPGEDEIKCTTSDLRANRKRGLRGERWAGSKIEDVLPDQGKFVDVEIETGPERGVGRKARGSVLQEEDEELSADAAREVSLQAAIEKQAETIVLGQMLLNPHKRRRMWRRKL